MEGTQARARRDTYLQKQARQLNSRVLSTAAARTRGDPFAKVKKANEEAGHKTWRESVPGSNEQTCKEKTTTAETLHADVDALNVATATLTVELAALSGDIARVGPAMGATTPRAEEKAKDTETIEDATAAPEAAGEALGVLKEFSARIGGASTATESVDIIGMLDAITSDFASLEFVPTATEETATKEYDAFGGLERRQEREAAEHRAQVGGKKRQLEELKAQSSRSRSRRRSQYGRSANMERAAKAQTLKDSSMTPYTVPRGSRRTARRGRDGWSSRGGSGGQVRQDS